MKLAEYAEARGKSIEEVKDALHKTGQSTHPNWNVHVDDLDAFFKDGTIPAPKPKEPDEEPATHATSDAPIPSEPVPAQVAAPEPVMEAAPVAQSLPLPTGVFGTYEPGMRVYDMTPRGKGSEAGTVFRAYGHDPSQAISAIIKKVPSFASNKLNWSVVKETEVAVKKV